MLKILVICGLLSAASGYSRADTLQLAQGSELTIWFSLPGFNPSNPASLFPTVIGLQLAASLPAGSSAAAIPGSTQNYESGFLLQGSLESLDGSVSLPLFDADAWRLGLAAGDLVFDGAYGGGAAASADVAVSLNMAQSIFGISGQAEFVLKNLGKSLTLGLGGNYSLSNAIVAPLSSANGRVQTSGYMQAVQVTPSTVPEPAVFGIAVGGAAVLFWLRRRLKPE